MDGSPKKKALLALRKQIQELIAHEEAEDPQAAADGHAEAAETMADSDMGDMNEEGAEKAPSDVQQKFMDYLRPKPPARRPGTGVVVASMSVKKEPEKKAHGRPKREVG